MAVQSISSQLTRASGVAFPSDTKMVPAGNDSPMSLYAAFRLAYLVNSFRRRIKTRVHSHGPRKIAAVQDELRHIYERQAFEEIDRYLGRSAYREGKSRAKTRTPSLGRHSEAVRRLADVHAEELPNSVRDTRLIRSTLDRLDANLPSKGYSLSEVAADDKLLFERRQKVDFKQHTTRELINDLTLIEYLLDSVRPAYQWLHGFNRPDNEDQIIEPPKSFEDEIFLANLEYMLLCLQGQVLYTLFIGHTSAEILRHVIECQKEQDRNDKHWFFEFPDARRPLSTTWPWSIRPSLAVIWGVCWMFYDRDAVDWDNDGNMRNTTTGEVLLTREELCEIPPSYSYLFTAAAGTEPPPQQGLAWTNRRARAEASPRTLNSTGNASVTARQNLQHLQQSYLDGSPAFALPGTYDVDRHSHAFASTRQVATAAQDDFTCEFCFAGNGQAAALPRRQYSDLEFAPYYPSSVPPISVYQPPQALHQGNLDWQNPRPSFSHSQNNMSSQTAVPLPVSGTPEHARQLSSVPQNEPERQTQRSRSVSSTSKELLDLEETIKSPFQSPAQSRAGSPARSADDAPERHSGGEDTASPLPQRDKPRSQPTIKDGKYLCTVCNIKPFDRRCEWNKHMDKHDRPYICKKPECSSLQGFTYSGGLLRHQREVHGLHGGAKLKLFCHMDGCKRRTQNPFTRRENLAEHLRRVHKLNTPEPTSPPTNGATSPDVDQATQDTYSQVVRDSQPVNGFRSINDVQAVHAPDHLTETRLIKTERSDSHATVESTASKKRKRDIPEDANPKAESELTRDGTDGHWKDEVKRLKLENEQLRQAQEEAKRVQEESARALESHKTATEEELARLRKQVNELVSATKAGGL